MHRPAELRKRQHPQVQVAEAMGVTQVRVARIEKGQLERSEVDALAAYVKALGGKLKVVADFLAPGRRRNANERGCKTDMAKLRHECVSRAARLLSVCHRGTPPGSR
ncbi:XRE family transcriptional regulator [Streptomyces sp. AK08-02]|uniref:XRE family transcriptional regulator n=1 Tax=Streptomyces sp. AK08-02 TaxID=3028654 RepID=UPI0029AFF5F0|nr:XRE family transcriptional regulator [Streptomyces sp. AK08-02]MDX3752302.1 XRE family transcriptional regulator [Streptomyces sp. AK08-02]